MVASTMIPPAWESVMSEERYYSAQEVADQLGVSVRTVKRWLKDGRIDAVLWGGRAGYRVAASDLEAFMLAEKRRRRAAAITDKLVRESNTDSMTSG